MGVESQIWPLVIVGKGSAAAYYICTVDLKLFKHVLAIGDEDAWAGARGHSGDEKDPTRRLNHPLHLIEHFKKSVPGFSSENVDRLAWAKMNKQVLEEANVRLYNAKVKAVSESAFPKHLTVERDAKVSGYKIETENGKTIYAYKVVMAAGAGSQRVPPELADWKKNHPKRFLNLDEFAKLGPGELSPKTTVIVLGPNAAIDAVQKAIHYKSKLAWLINVPIAKLPILSTQPTVRSAVDKDPSFIYQYKEYKIEKVFGDSVWVNVVTDKGKKQHIEGDYFVFGLGQDGAPVKPIDGAIKSKLKPILDKNQYLGGGPNTILGYEAEGTGLQHGFEVIGAMTAQVGRERVGILKKQIEAIRLQLTISQALTTVGLFSVKSPFLLKDPDFLASQPREPLTKQLKTEAKYVAEKFSDDPEVKSGLKNLVSVILAYQAAKNYQALINQAVSQLPSGTVGDGGQLTTIKAAMAAKHDHVPDYLPGQEHEAPDEDAKDRWVKVKQGDGDVNFSTDNATVLQIGLCQMYPFISDEDLNDWVEKLMVKRRKSGAGFDPGEVKRLHKELQQLNDKSVSGLSKL